MRSSVLGIRALSPVHCPFLFWIKKVSLAWLELWLQFVVLFSVSLDGPLSLGFWNDDDSDPYPVIYDGSVCASSEIFFHTCARAGYSHRTHSTVFPSTGNLAESWTYLSLDPSKHFLRFMNQKQPNFDYLQGNLSSGYRHHFINSVRFTNSAW